MVLILTLTPLTLEGLLTLTDGLWIVEIPKSRLATGCGLWSDGCRSGVPVTVLGLFRLLNLLGLSFLTGSLFFFLLLDEVFDNLINNLVALGFRHESQTLQRVLQLYGTGMGYEFVEHL